MLAYGPHSVSLIKWFGPNSNSLAGKERASNSNSLVGIERARKTIQTSGCIQPSLFQSRDSRDRDPFQVSYCPP